MRSAASAWMARSSRSEARAIGRPVVGRQDQVVGYREGEDQSEAVAVGRDIGDACGVDRPRRAPGDVAAVERDGAAGRLAQPDDCFDELVLAIPGNAGDAEDLAGANRRSMPRTTSLPRSSLTVRPRHRGRRRPGCDSPRSTVRLTSRPTISSARSSSSVSLGTRWPTTRPRRITVIRSAISRTS